MPRNSFDTPFEALAAVVLGSDHPHRLLFDTADHHAASAHDRAQKRARRRARLLLQQEQASKKAGAQRRARQEEADDETDGRRETTPPLATRTNSSAQPPTTRGATTTAAAVPKRNVFSSMPKVVDTAAVELKGGFEAAAASAALYPWAMRRLAPEFARAVPQQVRFSTGNKGPAAVSKPTRFADFQKMQQQQPR
jgi:hypothetical protein